MKKSKKSKSKTTKANQLKNQKRQNQLKNQKQQEHKQNHTIIPNIRIKMVVL